VGERLGEKVCDDGMMIIKYAQDFKCPPEKIATRPEN
jgi:hypothetical protein